MSITTKHTTLISLATVDKEVAKFVSTEEVPSNYDSDKFNSDQEYRTQVEREWDYYYAQKKELTLTRPKWEELGRPVTITLTLEGGDTLNG